MRGVKPRLVVDNGAVSKAPPVPAWLSKDAKAEWRRVVPIVNGGVKVGHWAAQK